MSLRVVGLVQARIECASCQDLPTARSIVQTSHRFLESHSVGFGCAQESERIVWQFHTRTSVLEVTLQTCCADACSFSHGIHSSAENQFERFRGFLELISRFEFEFCRRGFFFEGFEFLVCSKFNHTHHVAVNVHVLWPVCTHTIPSRMLLCP